MLKKHGEYFLSAPLKDLWGVGWVIGRKGMFEWKGKLLSFEFIQNLSIIIILHALECESLRHAWIPDLEDKK